MTPLKTLIQKQFIEKVRAGSFYPVTYTSEGIPEAGETPVAPQSIVCNETVAGLSDAKKGGARDFQFNLIGWNFECIISFDVEVDTSHFLLYELQNFHIKSEDGQIIASASFGNTSANHPVRQGTSTGTELRLDLTINTRR